MKTALNDKKDHIWSVAGFFVGLAIIFFSIFGFRNTSSGDDIGFVNTLYAAGLIWVFLVNNFFASLVSLIK